MGGGRRNEIAADEVFARTVAVFGLVMLLLAPCTLGLSLVFWGVWAWLARRLQGSQVESCIATVDARAWSIAGLTVGGVTREGVLWVVDDELFFSGRSFRGQWKLGDLRELAFERPILFRGLRWIHGSELFQISVPDVDGWMRVLSARS
jgi:hypothetical protein